jgi:hypothetical protein
MTLVALRGETQNRLLGDYLNYHWKAMYKVIEARIMTSWNGMQNTRIMYNKYEDKPRNMNGEVVRGTGSLWTEDSLLTCLW